MREYQSIPYFKERNKGCHVYAFDKIDGSNIRVEYSKKRGFYKFGSRTQLIDETHIEYGLAVRLFKEKYEKDLLNIIINNKRLKKAKVIIFFFEFYGENSFSGFHNPNDKKDLILIDVWESQLLKPNDFIEWFNNLHIPKIIYEGILDNEFVKDIRNNKYNLKDGVVIRGKSFICKLKTNDWLNRIKAKYGDRRYMEELN